MRGEDGDRGRRLWREKTVGASRPDGGGRGSQRSVAVPQEADQPSGGSKGCRRHCYFMYGMVEVKRSSCSGSETEVLQDVHAA